MTSVWRMTPVFRRWLLLTACLATVIAMSGLAHPSAEAAGTSGAQGATECGKADGALHVRGVRVYDASGKEFNPYGFTESDLAYSNYANGMAQEEAAIVASATNWCANTVRLQINQDLLVGADGKTLNETFMNAIETEVSLAEKYGLVVALNAQTEGEPGGGEPAPTAATIAFWQVMANAYRSDPKVIFDLFNEPRAINPKNCDTSSAWQLWRSGGMYKGKTYLGEQALVNSVRGADKAPNLLWVENICGSLDGVRTHRIKGTNIVYSIHHPAPPHTPANWDKEYGYLVEQNIAPVVDGEWTNYASSGPECWKNAPTAVPAYLSWLTQHDIGLTGWTALKGYLIESDNPDDPTVIRSNWRCVNGLDEGAGALLMAWFNQQNKSEELVNQAHGLCLDAQSQHDGSNADHVQLYGCLGGQNQFWHLSREGDEIVNQAHGLCLDAVRAGDGRSGDNVVLWACDGGNNQQWKAEPGHIFKNGAHGLCLDAQSQHDGTNGDHIQLWRCNGSSNQEWISLSG
jgi:hypothetical protein